MWCHGRSIRYFDLHFSCVSSENISLDKQDIDKKEDIRLDSCEFAAISQLVYNNFYFLYFQDIQYFKNLGDFF